MSAVWLDFETYSTVPISNGTHAYAEKAEIMLWAYALDDGPEIVWDRVSRSVHARDELTGLWGETPSPDMPADLHAALVNPENLVWGHNSGAFDETVLRAAMPEVYALVDEDRWRDTMVQAFAHSLPGALDKLGSVLNMADEDRKMADGRRLVLKFCKPDAQGRRATRETDPEDWLRFVQYAARDITVMRRAHKAMPMWNYRASEAALWRLDLRTNRRGFAVDLELAQAAVTTANATQAGMAADVTERTGGEVTSANQRDALLAHILASYGVELPDMRADTLERRLDDPELPEPVKDLLRIRLQASMNSVSKFKTLMRGVSSDGRLRGCMQFRGAGRTGRAAHRMFQPGNLPRPTLSHDMIESAILALKCGALDLVVDKPMQAMSSTIRGAIVAPPGKKLVIADLANIEGRVAAWLAGEEWKLQAFRDFDAGTGPDLYAVAYAKAFNVTPDVVMENKKHGDGLMRQIGKVMELMLQYEGGVSAFLTGAATYGIDLGAMAEAAWPTLPPTVVAEAQGFLDWLYSKAQARYNGAMAAVAEGASQEGPDALLAQLEAAKLKARHGLTEKVFLTCDTLKRLWRRAHPAISSYWKGDFENPGLSIVIKRAINSPGETFICRRLKTRRDGAWLRIQLPSGRALCYPNPKVEADDSISYTGFNQYTKQWGKVYSYGGKFFENCIARGTRVLTRADGWIPIEQVTAVDEVWDGFAWVTTGGAVAKGVQEVIKAHGAWMTPDHRVATSTGWMHASQSKGHDRLQCGLPDGAVVPREQWAQVVVERGLRVRQDGGTGGHGAEEAQGPGHPGFVWLQTRRDDRCQEPEARDGAASGVCRVAQYVGSLPAADASGVGELRRAGHHGVPSVAGELHGLLGGHGSDLCAGPDARPQAQRQWVQPGELSLDDIEGAGQQHPRQRAGGRGDCIATGREDECQEVDDVLPAEPRRTDGAPDRTPRLFAEVFDLLNCGPRSCFVVAADGLPLIVHNCTQAVAADQLFYPMPEIEARGYLPVLHVHDEIVSETPDTDDFTHEELARLMCADLGWNAGLPLAAAGFCTLRYRKD